MQTHAQHGSKKFKNTVPFYSPPLKLYGQTSAEIIKEARASVMLSPALGIKPVLTNRPFTPKEKERTLFGNLRNKNEHRYSLGLKNFQNQDKNSGLKLPSIENLPPKKNFSYFKCSHNISLDNLTEDYDAEILAEINEAENQKLFLPTKSYSCSKKGRIMKSSSCNELSKKILLKRKNGLQSCVYTTNENNDLDLLGNKLFDSDGSNNSVCKNMIKDSEDYEKIEVDSENLLPENNDKTEVLTKPLKEERGYLEKLYPLQSCKSETEQKDFNEKTEVLNHDFLSLKVKDFSESEKNFKKEKIILKSNYENETNNVKCIRDKSSNVNLKKEKEENNSYCCNLLLEKSTETQSNSEYLTMLKSSSKKKKTIFGNENSSSVPLEILELYETADYYGISNQEREKIEDGKILFEKKDNNLINVCNESPNVYLKDLKQNHEEINEQMKNLQMSICNIEKSINSNKHKRIANKQEISECTEFDIDNKKEDKQEITECTEFDIDNIKEDILGFEKKNKKEKVYEKYKDHQNSDLNLAVVAHQNSNESWDLFWKNSYFRSEKNERSRKDDLQQLIHTINGLNKLGAENKEIYEKFNELYKLIKSSESKLDSKLKNNIIKIIQLFSTNKDALVLLSLARLLFYLKEDSFLTMACKMIFKVAGLDTNDPLFLEEDDILELFMEGMGRTSPLDYAESCVYGYGALKFLTMNYNILSKILNLGALDLMTLHLKLINTTFIEKGNVGEQTHHALFQLTGALRNVAEGEGALPLFITTNCITVISKSLELFQNDEDVITNISRTLSLLSTHENIIEPLMSIPNFLNIVLRLMNKYKENDQILIRLSFCLGNIAEYNDLARVQLSRNEDCFIILLGILKFYVDKDLEMSMNANLINHSVCVDVIDDVIVKVIRIIANMSMNPIVGSNLSPTTTEKKSLQLAQLLSVLLMRKDPGITLLATLGCLNNISYYCKTHAVLIDITQGVERALELPSGDCQAEAARVLGNLTRHKEIRNIIFNTGGINKLIKLLSSGKQEVVRYTCGVLVNITLDSESRLEFVKAQGINKLVEAVEMFSEDWSLASLAARVIWNSCAENVSFIMKHNNVEHLLNLLANSLEEENWNDGNLAWEEFAIIATDLLEKINSYLEA